MRIWTVIVAFVLFLSIFVGGQLQTSLKGKSGGNIFQQNDNDNKQLSHSSFRHVLDGGNQSLALQPFPYETRRLGTTQQVHPTDITLFIIYTHTFFPLFPPIFHCELNEPFSHLHVICSVDVDGCLNAHRASSPPLQALG